MALDFPASPSNGQSYIGSSGTVWVWDGAKWNGAGGGGAYLPLTGGQVTGSVGVGGTGVNYPSIPNGNHGMSFAWDGSRVLSYVDNTYIGPLALGNFLPLTGGQLTGRLVLNPSANGGADLVLQNSGGNYTHIFNDGNTRIGSPGGLIILDPASWVQVPGSSNTKGVMVTSAATGSYCVWYDDGNTHFASTTALWLDSPINISGRLQNNAGRIISFNATYPGFCCYSPGYAAGMFLSGNTLYFGNMDGGGTYIGPPFAYFTSAGRFNALASATITGELSIYGGTFYNGYGDGWLYFNGSLRTYDFHSNNNVYAEGSLFCGGCQLYNNGGVLYTPQSFKSAGSLDAANGTVFLNGMYWQNNGGWMYTPYAIRTDNYIRLAGLDVSNNQNCLYAANLWSANDTMTPGVLRRYPYGTGPRGARLECWAGSDWDNVCFAMGGGNFLFSPDLGASGFYVTPSAFPSDARLKDDIRDTEIDALSAILATPVRAFKWNDEGIRLQPHITEPEVRIGFVAQEVEQTMPSAVEPSPFKDGNLHIRDHDLTPYMMRAIQQLEARIRALEKGE